MIIDNKDTSLCKCCSHPLNSHIITINDDDDNKEQHHFAGCHILISDHGYGDRVLTYSVCDCKGYEAAF